MARDYAAEIASKQAELETLRHRMQLTSDDFVSAAAAFLEDWFPEQARREVEHDADTTLRLDPSDVASLKAEVSALATSAADVARAALNKDSVWWHRTMELPKNVNHGSDPYRIYNTKLPDILGEPMRFAMGSLARILEPRGFLRSRSGSSYLPWRKDADRYSSGSSAPYFPEYHFQWPATLLEIAERYAREHKDAIALRSLIQQLEAEKKRSEASRIWDSV